MDLISSSSLFLSLAVSSTNEPIKGFILFLFIAFPFDFFPSVSTSLITLPISAGFLHLPLKPLRYLF